MLVHKGLLGMLFVAVLACCAAAVAQKEVKPGDVCSADTINTIIRRLDALEKPQGLSRDLYLSKKISRVEELIDGDNKVIKLLVNEVDELERKVAGVQKQVTILHAKKADKENK